MIFVGIIGTRNSGKSSLIQSISGCRSASFRGYLHGYADQSIYVCASSPQESRYEFSGTFDQPAIRAMLKQAKTRRGCRGVVMALWPNKPSARPSMEDIYNEVLSAGYDSVYGYPIDPGFKSSSKVFSKVKDRLQALDPSIEIMRIQGYHFPLVNAEKINSHSNIVS